MADRIRQLLYSLQSAQRGLESGGGAEIGHITRQLTSTLRRVADDAIVPRDEKLTCVSLALDSDDPPDLLCFLTWPAHKALHTPKTAVLKELYALLKQHQTAPFMAHHTRGLFLRVWDMFKADVCGKGVSSLQVGLLKLVGLLAKVSEYVYVYICMYI